MYVCMYVCMYVYEHDYINVLCNSNFLTAIRLSHTCPSSIISLGRDKFISTLRRDKLKDTDDKNGTGLFDRSIPYGNICSDGV